MNRKGKIWNYDKMLFSLIVKESNSYSEILKKLGLKPIGNNRYNLKERIELENININHLINNRGFGWSSGKSLISKEEALKYFINKSQIDRGSIKKYILRFNLITYECKNCGVKDTWNGKKIILDLDHINGNRHDNRILNLRFLCPNCHSQEKTSNRNLKNKTFDVEDVKLYIIESKSKRELLYKMKVADTGTNYKKLNLIIKNYNLSFPVVRA